MEPGLVDWTRLPQDLLIAIFEQLEIPDLVRSGAVCTLWHSGYSNFRHLRLPSPMQSPCLLCASDRCGPNAAALYCPSTGTTFRIPMPEPTLPLRSLSSVGSGHGWLVVADGISNLHLLNPLTGGHVALPPITTIEYVDGSLDEQGNLVYTFSSRPEHPPFNLPAREARFTLYERAILSCNPSAGGACVVLLVHVTLGELSFARVGDERWTRIALGDQRRHLIHHDATYNTADGLFYVVAADDSVLTLDLNGSEPVAKKIVPERKANAEPFRYLVQTPWGDLLQVERFRDYLAPPTYMETESYFPGVPSLLMEPSTTKLLLYKVDVHGQRLVKVDSLGDHALFLGYNGSMCLPVKDFPGLKPNCAYITDDPFDDDGDLDINRREIGVWSIQDGTFHSFRGTCSPLHNLSFDGPAPIWITPSLL